MPNLKKGPVTHPGPGEPSRCLCRCRLGELGRLARECTNAPAGVVLGPSARPPVIVANQFKRAIEMAFRMSSLARTKSGAYRARIGIPKD
jgi:hypothetical protein